MHRFFTPLLRRAYVGFALILVAYFITPIVLQSNWNKARLYRQLLAGDKETKVAAAANLARYGGDDQLFQALQSDSNSVRDAAANALANHWFNAAAPEARDWLQRAMERAEQREFKQALIMLTTLTHNFPEYAEAWNRRAVLFWKLGQFERAISDCQRVVILNPENFFAWQEMGMCHIRLGNYSAAARSLQSALQINPFDVVAQRMLRRCEEMIRRQNNPPRESSGELV